MYRVKTKLGSVIEVKGWWRRKLYINGYPQTQWSYRRDWKTILRRSRVDNLPRNGSALVLGLGGGDVVKLLTNYQTNVTIVAVEIEKEVVEVASKYFGIRNDEKLTVVIADAKKYMNNNRAKYDLVVVDLYSGDEVPEFVTTDRFLRQIAKALKHGGKAIFNYASHSFGGKEFAAFERKLKSVFDSVTPLNTWGHTYYLVS